MNKPPFRRKEVTVTFFEHSNPNPMLKIGGTAIEAGSGTRVVGYDDAQNTWQVEFSESLLRGAGHPPRGAARNMTIVLRNHIARVRHHCGPVLAEQYEGRGSSTYHRAYKQAKPHIRIVCFGRMEKDRRIFAIAFMHDDHKRGKSRSGPAWVLFEGEAQARFVKNAEVRMT